MRTVTGYWFAPRDGKLANGDGREIRVGITHKVEGNIIPCKHGLHLSIRPIDALKYAPGPIIYKVRGSGTIVPHGDPINKYACSERTYLAGGHDCTELLRRFACKCALDVVHLWDAPDIVVEYLRTGNEKLRDAAWAAALDAARDSVLGAARTAAWAAAWNDTWAAAWAAIRGAANAMRAATRGALRDNYMGKANKRLTSMLAKKK